MVDSQCCTAMIFHSKDNPFQDSDTLVKISETDSSQCVVCGKMHTFAGEGNGRFFYAIDSNQ